MTPIPDDARSKNANSVMLDQLWEAAFHGDSEILRHLLFLGKEKHGVNGDVNTHFTDVNALHVASMAGHAGCVRLLLKAKADPHVRTVVKDGQDPATGETARQKALKFNHISLAEMLLKAERSQTNGVDHRQTLCIDQHRAMASTAPSPEQTLMEAGIGGLSASAVALPVALLFPGQGSQYVRMLEGIRDVPEVQDLLNRAGLVLGYDLLELCLQGPEEKLEQTQFCQPAMFVAGLAAAAKLRSDRGEAMTSPACVAGLSLGEYTALCAAGVVDFEDGLRLVKLRGEAMQEAATASQQLMVSVVGLERIVLDDLCDKAAAKEGPDAICMIANELFPKGFSCAGTRKAILELKQLADSKGAFQAKVLKTGGAFHTPLMRPAQEKLQAALDSVLPKMKPPSCAVYMNVTGKPLQAGADPAVVVELLRRQLVSPVLWAPSVQRMIADGVDEFFECGPQKQLKAIMKRIDSKAWNRTSNVEV